MKSEKDKKGFEPLSEKLIDDAHAEFQKLYNSFPMKLKRLKLGLKTLLRKRCGILYAMLKNAHVFFKRHHMDNAA